MIELTAFFASLVRVFARAFQQKNVTGNHYTAVPVFSYLMTLIEVWIISVVVTEGFTWLLVFSIGTGGALGAIAAMKLHTVCFGGEAETYRSYARRYIDGIKHTARGDEREGPEQIRKYYKTDLISIYLALDALWMQINRSKR